MEGKLILVNIHILSNILSHVKFYQLKYSNSTLFQLQHNVCGRGIYAEGTVDAIEFLQQIRSEKPSKRLYNMIDVLESGKMS